MLWLERDINSALVLIFATGSIKVKCLASKELAVTGGTGAWVIPPPQAAFPSSTPGILFPVWKEGLRSFQSSPPPPIPHSEKFCFVRMWINESEAFFCNHRWILPISLWEEESPVLVSFKRKSVFWSTPNSLCLASSRKSWMITTVWSSQVSAKLENSPCLTI